jgi:hypothetical protein
MYGLRTKLKVNIGNLRGQICEDKFATFETTMN